MSQSWRINKLELDYVKTALKSGFPGAQSTSFVHRLESGFAKKFDSTYAITFTNGTCTMHAALWACGIGAGDEVIVPPLTMSATMIAVLHVGATPVFADVDAQTFNLSAATVAPRITRQTRAIMPVSLYGLPAALPDLMSLAKKHKLRVIEDSAQCFLGKVDGRTAGAIGDIGSFSFQNTKHMTCGEGGVTITRDLELADRMRRFSSLGYGMVSAVPGKSKIDKNLIASPNTERHTDYGYNYRLSEINAAVALAQLEKLDMFVDKRIAMGRMFEEEAAACGFLRHQATPPGLTHSYWACAMRLDTERVAWKEFQSEFLKNGGDGFYGAWRLAYDEPYYAGLFPEAKGTCPNAEDLQPRMVQLKTHYGSARMMKSQALALRRTIKKFK